MSKEAEQEKVEVPLAERQEVARKINQEFARLNPDEQRDFVDQTLTVLVNMNKKKLQKMFSKLFFKKGKPTTKDLEMINQLVVVFLYSIKDEFRPHYATMVLKGLRQPLPDNIPETLARVRELKWLHFGLLPEVYDATFAEWDKQGRPDYDAFFKELLSRK